MPDDKKQLISLLRSFVQESAPEPAAPWNAAALWQSCVRQNLLPILAYENKRWKLFDDPKVCQQLDGLLYGAVAGNLNRRLDFETLSRSLSQRGIAHMPVKGYYLRELYPLPELRTFGDIDILIHEADRQKVHALMQDLGYAVDHDWEPTYSYHKDAELYEIHTNLMDGNLDGRAALQDYFSSAWDHAEPDAELRFRPAPDFHLIYTVCHLAKHLYGGGAGLRMYLDVALYVRHFDKTLNWEKITEEFTALRLMDFFCTVMNACRVWFGMETVCPLPGPDAETLDMLLSYTLDSDLFGLSRDHGVIHLRNAAEEKTSKARTIRRMLFPPADEIASRYTFLQRCPWLLPTAWVVRLLANLKRIPLQLHAIRGVSAADPDEVSSYDSFMQKLGL